MVNPVSDIGSNAEENIAHAAKVLGRSKHRRSVFETIYTGKRKAKKVSDLIRSTKLPHRRVLDAGKRLADNRLIKPIKLDGETAYEKIDFFQSNKRRILNLASSPAKLKAFPTKRNPRPATTIVVRVSERRSNAKLVTIDEINSFRKVRKIKASAPELGNELSESSFKQGLQRILGEGGRFKDWGGEVSDLFTTKCKLNGRRCAVALALKGPATKGKLTPGKMGKNGDQIQRLFETPAKIFLVQYCRQIDPSVLKQMKDLAMLKSQMTGDRVFYGIIDGSDSRRLVLAYPDAFNAARRHRRKR